MTFVAHPDRKQYIQHPQDILNELGSLKERTGIKIKDKEAANLSFQIIQIIRSNEQLRLENHEGYKKL